MRTIIERVKELNLPKDQFLVSGSGILDLLGIRKSDDIDLLVSPSLFENLKEKHGWSPHHTYKTTIVHPSKNVEAKYSLDFMKENYSLAQLLPHSYIKEGVHFLNLKVLKESKFQLGRKKDLSDIKLIDAYLKEHKHYFEEIL